MALYGRDRWTVSRSGSYLSMKTFRLQLRSHFRFLFCLTSLFFVGRSWAVNSYMVENTTGTDPSGNACYYFQTTPTCYASITGFSGGGGGSTNGTILAALQNTIPRYTLGGPATTTVQGAQNLLNDGTTVRITSNTVLTGTTFYADGNAALTKGTVTNKWSAGSLDTTQLTSPTGNISSEGANLLVGNVIYRGQGPAQFNDATNTNAVLLEAPSSVSANYTLVLPLAQSVGTGNLQNDGTGVLSWVAPSGGGGGTNGTIQAGAQNKLSKYVLAGSTTTVGPSLVSDDGSTMTYTGSQGIVITSTYTGKGFASTSSGNWYFNKAGDPVTKYQILGSSTVPVAGQFLVPTSSNTMGPVGFTSSLVAVDSNGVAVSTTIAFPLVAGTSTYAPVLSSGTITPSALLVKVIVVNLASNITLNGPTGGINGQPIEFRLVQDGSTRTVTLSGDFIFGTSITSLSLSGGGSKTDEIGVIWNAIKSKWEVLSVAYGF